MGGWRLVVLFTVASCATRQYPPPRSVADLRGDAQRAMDACRQKSDTCIVMVTDEGDEVHRLTTLDVWLDEVQVEPSLDGSFSMPTSAGHHVIKVYSRYLIGSRGEETSSKDNMRFDLDAGDELTIIGTTNAGVARGLGFRARVAGLHFEYSRVGL